MLNDCCMTRCVKKRICFFSALLLCGLLLIAWIANQSSIAEQLTSIDATRMIPDEDNAAVEYVRILKLHPERDYPDALDDVNDSKTMLPWRSVDYPEIAVWIKEHQGLIDELSHISEMDQCVFPLTDTHDSLPYISDPNFYTNFSTYRHYAFILRRAAYNDLGEGCRLDAIAKAKTILTMGHHWRQQPDLICLLTGMSFDSMGLSLLAGFMVDGNASNAELDLLALDYDRTEENYRHCFQQAVRVSAITDRKARSQLPAGERLKQWWDSITYYSDLPDEIWEGCQRNLAMHKAHHLLIALCRVKNQTSQWPESLDHITPSLPPQWLIDPMCNKPLVYKRVGDAFCLYSLGLNGIDENGQYKNNYPQKANPDDISLWPPF